jgi:hypothetical protein
MRRLIVAALVAAGIAGLAGVANADPIVCPPGQTSQQVAPGVFACVNHGGNPDNSADPRNPNR